MSVTAPRPAAISVHLDVEQLDRSVAFYHQVFGFKPTGHQRRRMLLETEQLRTPAMPFFELALRESFGKRVIGSQAGSVTGMAFAVPDLKAEVARLLPMTAPNGPVRWFGPTPSANPEVPHTRLKLIDPDAYVIELVQA